MIPTPPPEVAKLTDFMRAGPTDRMPAGFFVASDVWDALAQNPEVKTGAKLHANGQMTTPTTGGIPIACDPKLPPGQVDVALTPRAWRDRLDTLKVAPNE